MPRRKYTKYLTNPHRIYVSSHRTLVRFTQNLKRKLTQSLEIHTESRIHTEFQRVFTQNEVYTELKIVIHTELSYQEIHTVSN